MRYPNAYAGVKKVFTSEILTLIAACLVSIAVLLAASGVVAYDSGEASKDVVGVLALGAALFALPALIIEIVSEILMLVGLYQSSKDEPNYMKKAFWAAIAMLVLSLISGFVGGADGAQSMADTIFQLLNEFLALVIMNFTIEGIGLLGQNIGRNDLLERGRRLMMWLTIAIVLSIVAALASNWVGAIAGLIAIVLYLMVLIGYLMFLSRAKNALAQA